ncbi:hypothetical protein MCEMAEM21_01542 [Oxalobacteraceae bacterium]|jgi:hypothetical protein
MAAVSLVGCASITKGTSQTIVFNIEPKGTTCVATRDGDGEIGSVSTSNNTLKVSKDKDDIVVKCSAPGYKQKVTRLVSKTETAGVVGGAFIDLGITDMMTGAMWAYPNDVSIVLEKEGAGSD